MRVRQPISSSSAAGDLAILADGVRAMRERSNADLMDPLGWYYQSRVHGAAPRQPEAPPGVDDFDICQHRSWWFLPWHRMFLIQFEKIIAFLTGETDFALPYWDYPSADAAAIPVAFLDPQSPLGSAPLPFPPPQMVEFRGELQTPKRPTPETWRRASTFTMFGGEEIAAPMQEGKKGGQLETAPHNVVHSRFSGVMASLQSPTDPLFWVHHCNIDRLWHEWLGLGNHANPTASAWARQAFSFPDPTAANGRATFRVGDVATLDILDYSYAEADAGPILAAMAEDVPDRNDDRLELLGSSGHGGTTDDEQELVPDAAAWSSFRSSLGPDAALAAHNTDVPLYLQLENVGLAPTSDLGGALWSVLLRVGDDDAEVVGTIASFGLAELTAQGGRETLVFDISDLAERILALGDEVRLTVSFAPAVEGVQTTPYYEQVGLYTTEP